MKKTTLTALVTAILLTCSCKKILDTQPRDFVTATNYFSKAADATSALNSAYYGLHAQYLYGGYWLCRSLGADDIYCIYSTGFPAVWGIDASDSSGQLLPLWSGLYNMIEQCNVVLKYLPQVSTDQATRNAIQGEALFLRGFCYFQLVDQWGAVPLRTEPTAGANDISIPRTPVADVYKQILSDMTAAEALVPDATTTSYGGSGYPAKTTVEGILARVCLTMAGYPLKDVSKYKDAKTWCQKVIASGLHSLNPDFTKVFDNFATETQDKKEVLWEIDMDAQAGQRMFGYLGYLDGVQTSTAANAAFGTASGQVRCTRKLYNLYAAGNPSPDVRRDYTIGNYQYQDVNNPSLSKLKYYSATETWDRFENKYKIYLTPQPHTVGNSPINFPMLRYSDILLMLAEADNYVSNGPTTLAYSCVNQVRERAYGKMLAGATNPAEADVPQTYDQTTFQQLIMDERCREFAAEGLRKHDLIRWGLYIANVRNLALEVDDPSQPKIPPTDYWYLQIKRLANAIKDRDVLWPIPASELTYNKLMTQNPGW